MIAKLFEVNVATINEHIKNSYNAQELVESSTIRDFLIVQKEGRRDIKRNIDCFIKYRTK